VLGHDPWKRYRIHPDHRQAGWLVIDAVVAARDPLFFPEQGPPHRPERLLLFEPEVVDHVEDARAGLEAKREALLCHTSQWRTTMGVEDGSRAPQQLEAFGARLQEEAEEAGAPFGLEQAEVFKRLEPL
jgi:LmbE family N-acetylglucosaminyl deacetylase